jgi:hypothetical protein
MKSLLVIAIVGREPVESTGKHFWNRRVSHRLKLATQLLVVVGENSLHWECASVAGTKPKDEYSSVGFKLQRFYFCTLWALNGFYKGKYQNKVAEMHSEGLKLLLVLKKWKY